MPSALSISSHVAHGYVGNRAMVFPLQCCGWDVDALNTTHYSNHPGYGHFKGAKSTATEIKDILQGLGDIEGLYSEYDMIITGYTPTADTLATIYDVISASIFGTGHQPAWILDPVFGDNGRMYVLEELVPVYRTILQSGLIALTTPNQFEFETLCGQTLTSMPGAIRAAFEKFAWIFPKVDQFVISSIVLLGKMYSLGYNKGKIFSIEISQIKSNFNGCGDLFTALLADAFHANECELTPQVLGDVVLKISKVLHESYRQESLKHGQVTVVRDLSLISLCGVFQSLELSHYNVEYL